MKLRRDVPPGTRDLQRRQPRRLPDLPRADAQDLHGRPLRTVRRRVDQDYSDTLGLPPEELGPVFERWADQYGFDRAS